MEKKKKFKIGFPETALLLLIIIGVVAALTYIMPAGQFERVVDPETGRELVKSGTYAVTESNPTSLTELFSSVFRGLVKASEIIAFIFVVGGAFGIVSKTGAIAAGLSSLVKKLQGRETVMVSIIMTAFAICGATFGMAEEALPFVAILVVVSLQMGFDPIAGIAMVVIGLYCGYATGPLNPFNTGIAQGIAELPLFSGIGLRIVLMIGALVIAIFFVVRHGKKYKKLGIDNSELLAEFSVVEERPLNKTDRIVLLVLTATIIVLIFGVIKFQWYFNEISALFFGMGLITGVVYRKNDFNQIARDFVEGACEMTTAAILSPLSDLVGVTRQTAVLAFQCGDGFWNMITPTHSVLMASLGLARVPFGKWFKFAFGLVAAWTVWVLIVLAFATVTNYGPY